MAGLYTALLQYFEAKELLRFGPFDTAQCLGATLDDLDVEGRYRFIRDARRARQFQLPAETEPPDLLRHLNLLSRGRLTNAAILLFGRDPQRLLISSEIQCAHFHGTRVTNQSVPGNPLLAESMYPMRYIEKMGTGTADMIRRCPEAGLPDPECDVAMRVIPHAVRCADSFGARGHAPRSPKRWSGDPWAPTRAGRGGLCLRGLV